MKKFVKSILSLLCAAALIVPVLAACNGGNEEPNKKPETPSEETVDYVSQLHLDFTSNTKKQEVKVKLYIDGDTTHFDPVTNSQLTGYNAEDFANTQGYIKARYLAINTPESTGKIEKWGKTASNFTHDKLAAASAAGGSIIVESDDDKWNVDSTGERYTLWIWYRLPGETEFRNLNLEILQNGFALASSTANNRYGEIASAALAQAQRLKLHVFSPADTVDENYYEGDAFVISLRELRLNIANYLQKWVRVEGVVTARFSNSVYIEEYDPETETYFGFAVYYGFQSGAILEVLAPGNRVSVYGSVTEFQGTYQISGVEHNEFRPNSPTNTNIIGEEGAYEGAYLETSAKDIVSNQRKVEISYVEEDEDGEEQIITKKIDYRDAIMSTSVTVKNLKITNIYTTNNGGDSDGAMSIYCTAEDGTSITIRTEVLVENGQKVTADRFLNEDGKTYKMITVRGIVDKYTSQSGSISYQVAVFHIKNIDILG